MGFVKKTVGKLVGSITGSGAAKATAAAAEQAAQAQARLAQEQAKEAARQAAMQTAQVVARQNAATAIEEAQGAEEVQDVDVQAGGDTTSVKRRRARYSASTNSPGISI